MAVLLLSRSFCSGALDVAAAPRLSGHSGGRSLGSKKKIRHHVNPLKSHHQAELAILERWPERAYAAPAHPLHVDIGCARGLFCLDLAAARPELNVLGLEIRAALAEAAEADARAAGLGNAHFLACNANVNLDALLRRAAPRARVGERPVPRPVVQGAPPQAARRAAAARARAAEHLAPGGWLLLQPDVRDVAEAMRATVRDAAAGLLVDARADADDGARRSPTRSATSRRSASARCSPARARRATRAYRAVFHKL